MPQKNFTVKVDLDEANLIREALREKLDRLTADIQNLSDSDRVKAGAIDTMLRRDFG